MHLAPQIFADIQRQMHAMLGKLLALTERRVDELEQSTDRSERDGSHSPEVVAELRQFVQTLRTALTHGRRLYTLIARETAEEERRLKAEYARLSPEGKRFVDYVCAFGSIVLPEKLLILHLLSQGEPEIVCYSCNLL
jgi:Mg2+ and Co2+ transporter CorA